MARNIANPGVAGSNAGASGGGAPTGAAGGSLTGTYPNPTIATIPSGATATTQSATDGSTKVATTAYVDTADALKANLASPTFTGTVTLPTGTVTSGMILDGTIVTGDIAASTVRDTNMNGATWTAVDLGLKAWTTTPPTRTTAPRPSQRRCTSRS